MAHSLFRKVVHRDSEAMLLRKFKFYLLLTIVPAFATSICLLAGTHMRNNLLPCLA